MLRLGSLYLFFVLVTSYSLLVISGNQGATWWTERNWFQRFPAVGPSVVLNQLEPSPTEKKTFYRHDLQRTGYYDEEVSAALSLKKLSDISNFSIHQASKSSPLVLKDQIILATDAGLLASIDFNGKENWRLRNFTSAFGFHSTPAAWGDLIIAGDYSGLLVALDKKNGKLSWILQLGDTFGASPLITDDGYIIVSVETQAPNGFIAKVNAKNGEVIWTSVWLGDHSHSSPSLSQQEYGGSKVIVVGDNAGYVNGLRETDGKMIWRYYLGQPMKSTAAIFKEQAFFATWDGYIYAMQVDTGAVLWRKRLRSANQSSVAIDPQGTYGVINSTRGLCRFSLTATKDLVCEEKEYSRGPRKASPVITKDKDHPGRHLVWTGCDDTNLCVFDLQSFKRLKTWALPGRFSGEVVPHEGKIFFIPENGGTFQLSVD